MIVWFLDVDKKSPVNTVTVLMSSLLAGRSRHGDHQILALDDREYSSCGTVLSVSAYSELQFDVGCKIPIKFYCAQCVVDCKRAFHNSNLLYDHSVYARTTLGPITAFAETAEIGVAVRPSRSLERWRASVDGSESTGKVALLDQSR